MQDSRFNHYMNWNKKKEKSYEHHVKCKCHVEKKCEEKQDQCKCEHKWERKHEKCKCEWEHKEDKCPCKKEEKCYCEEEQDHRCKGCICHQLRCLSTGAFVDVILAGGGSFTGVYFVSLDPKTCCATFFEVENAVASPLIIDCQQIVAIRSANPA